MKNYSFKINGKEYNVAIGEAEGKMLTVNVNGADYQVELDQAPAAAPAAPKAAGAGSVVKSPLPGIIISVDVKEGQAVKRGQKVAVVEAMKMENDILAECDGTVTAVHARKGDSVLEGADIVTIG